jgi:hypothetical protein
MLPHKNFQTRLSNHLTALNALYAYEIAEQEITDGAMLNRWCQLRFLIRRSLDEVFSVRDMIMDQMSLDDEPRPFSAQERADVR